MKLPPRTHVAYLYQPHSEPVDGWYTRMEVLCDELGSLQDRPWLYARIRDEKWVYLGHWPIGQVPDNAWDAARSRRT